TIGSGGSSSRLSRLRIGSGQAAPSSAPAAGALAGAAACGWKRTSQSPPPISRASWLKPFDAITLNSGVGLKVASSRSPCPGLSEATAPMISWNGSPPDLRMGRTSSSANCAVMVLSSLGSGPVDMRDQKARSAGALGKAAWRIHVGEAARADQVRDHAGRGEEHRRRAPLEHARLAEEQRERAD